jgi:hypothetical protein
MLINENRRQRHIIKIKVFDASKNYAREQDVKIVTAPFTKSAMVPSELY